MLPLLSWLALFGACPAHGGDTPLFSEAARDLGVDFRHVNGMVGEFYFPEMTGQGGALFDYDGDGDLDLYAVQGGVLGADDAVSDFLIPPADGAPFGDRLYRNDLERGELHFTDVSERSRIRAFGYGMAVAVGDVDNDGHPDLYLGNYGPNELWRNRGDGSFEKIEGPASLGAEWTTAATFVDADGDGLQDLFVVNYVDFDVAANPRCFATNSRRDYCGPSAFAPQQDRLLRNTGGGRFEDVTAAAGLGLRAGPGLGVLGLDADEDGDTDLLVANDGAANFLWLNQGGGRFREDALFSGVAVNAAGRPEASMGIASGDFDRDGDRDLFLTHLAEESNTLYMAEGGGLYADRSREAGVVGPGWARTGFGTGALDVDGDGWLDLMVVNGAVRRLPDGAGESPDYPLAEPNLLLLNRGGHLEDASSSAGGPFTAPHVSRGVALGDLDNDGDTDAAVFNSAGRLQIFLRRNAPTSAWVGAELTAAGGRGWVNGARAQVVGAEPPLVRWVQSDGSYASSSDPRLLFALPATTDAVEILVTWPGGREERFTRVRTQRYNRLVPGSGRQGEERK